MLLTPLNKSYVPPHKSHAKMLMDRMTKKILPLPEVFETLFGFKADKGIRDVIFSLRTVMERAIEVQKCLYLCFINCSKTFDGKDHRVIRNVYWEEEATIIDNDCSVYKLICR